MKRILIIAMLALPIFAQQAQNHYTKIYEKTLSAASGVSSIQQPSSPSRTAHLIGFQLYCSVACTVTFDAGGAASGTNTNGTTTSPGQTEVSTVVHYADSNAVAATNPINKYVVPAGSTIAVLFTDGRQDARSNSFLGKTAGQNFTLRSDAITGDVKFTWFWREEN